MKLANIQPIISRNNDYFHKIFRYFAVTTFILFFCFTMIIAIFTMRGYTNEIENSSVQNLDASMTVSESTLSGLYSYCHFLFYNNDAVNDILFADHFSSELSIKFSSLGNDFLNYYNLIESVYLVNFQADMVFSNITTRQTIDTFYDQDILRLLADHQDSVSDFLFVPRTVSQGAPRDVVSLVFRATNGNAFVINLSRSSYEELLNHNTMCPETLVINSYGHILNGSDSMDFASDVSDTDWYRQILSSSKSEGSFTQKLYSRQYTIFYRKNASFRFTYATMLETSPFSTKNTMLFSTLISFVIFTFAGLGLSLFLSYTLYLPVNNLTKLLKPYARHSAAGHPDEFSYLTDTFTDLVNTSTKNQKQIHLAKRSDFLHRILTVTNYYNSLKKETMLKYGITFDSEYYQVILFSLDSASLLLSNNPTDYTLMMDSLRNIASELLPDSLSLEVENGVAAYILFLDTDASDTFADQIAMVRQCMNDYFKETVTIGVGFTCDSPADLHESFNQAKLAMRYRFLAGNNSIINYSDCPSGSQLNFMLQEQKDIISAAFSCKESAAKEKLAAYFELLKDTPIDNMIMNIMALNASFQNAEAQSDLVSMNQLSYDNDPYSHYTLDEIHEQFSRRISADITQLQEIRQNITVKPQIIDEVTDYVDTHLCSVDLTVENVASHIHLSTNYLRNIFKEHMGISLSKYITDRKIQYACKVLVETDDSIQSLCERLDFTSVNYFYTYFKKNTGMTPSQYRESHRQKP